MTEDTETTVEDAYETLSDTKGQQYYTSETALEMLLPFAARVDEDGEYIITDEFVSDHYPYETEKGAGVEERQLTLSHALRKEQKSGHDARGMVTVWPHQQIVTVADISDIICEALGVEPAEGSGAGAGFYADSKHRGNMEKISEVVNVSDVE